MTTAPYYTDLAFGPTPEARFVVAEDGTRIRIALWRGGARGTILLAQGRAEYLEKYGDVIPLFLERGFSVAALDWRGQGLSDRPIGTPEIGDIEDYAHFQQDLAAMLADKAVAALPGPRILVAHSMGGCIMLRALLEGLNIQAAVFSAPMWGIRLPALLAPIAHPLANAITALGFGPFRLPGSGALPYTLWQEADGNLLTSHHPAYERQRDQLFAAPDLRLGGPSFRWIARSIAETRRLAKLPNPGLPILTLIGGDEGVVSADAIRTRAAKPGNHHLVEIPGGRHEMFFETPAIRQQLWQEIDSFLADHA